MEKYEGKSILKRTAIGKMRFYSRGEQLVQRKSIADVDAELARYEAGEGAGGGTAAWPV